MIILDVNKLEKNFGKEMLFKDITFSLNEGESIAIVGPNGCGKSTLLKIIAGVLNYDSGNVTLKKDTKLFYLDQLGNNIDGNKIVIDILKESFTEINTLEKQINDLQNKINNDSSNTKLLERYCNLIDKFSLIGGYEVDKKIQKIVKGLDISEDNLNKEFNVLSGGEKTIIQLAVGLLKEANLLLLDEPTNHLDLNKIEWLESYIKSFKGACVIVSHDRYFLDKMANQILSLDEYGNSKIYHTNYSGYLEIRESEIEKNLELYESEQEKIKQLEIKAKQFMSLGMARNSSTLTKQGKVLFDRAQRLRENCIKRPRIDKKMDMSFQEKNKSSKKIISTKNLCIKTNDGVLILDKVNVDILSEQKVAILGENGSGKSTFIKTILGKSDLVTSGEVYVGPNVKIGYIPQIIEFSDDNLRVLEYFMKTVGLSEEISRSILSKFKFDKEKINTRLSKLSGGEKMKLKMAELLQYSINTLIFDEPTNHIDIPTKEVLENAIEEFSGTLIFISHDRFFINKFADRILIFNNHKVEEFFGNYDKYRESIR